jgi:signal transduction histidine kinase/CheY-like chemotaxis protein/HAMP domain-containing protein
MKIKNIKIGTQLKIAFASMLVLILLLGTISYFQSNELFNQNETMYNHPLQVQMAIGEFRADILYIQRNMKDVFITQNKENIAKNLREVELYKANGFEQINIFYKQYLGPRSDVDSVKKAYIIWNALRDETIDMYRNGNIKNATERISSNGIVGHQAELVLTALNKIDDFATNKVEKLYSNSVALKKSLTNQLLIIIILIIILTFIINYILLRNIRKPIIELTNAAYKFHQGDMNSRSLHESENEFGTLSKSFNTMVEGIQISKNLDEKVGNLAALMLSEYDVKKFFKSTLNAIAEHTESQMAAIYLLSNDKKSFEHFESTGVDNNARQSFSAESLEGEFGLAISSHKVQHIQDIKEDTRFVFHTVSGKFIPREIITIPIIVNNEVVAIISLANLHTYSQQSITLIDNILATLCARVEGILAYHKTIEFSKKLEFQNSELESQKTELASQSAELIEQNIELEMQKNQLNEASRLKTNFLSNMSHELRTPLNSVIALSGVLNRRLHNQIPEEEYSYLEVIERNGKNLLELINDILDISRIEAGKEEIEITDFNAHDSINEVIGMIQPQAKQKQIELIYNSEKSKLTLTSDATKCRHILQNLISNAIKFTEKGKVEITTTQIEHSIQIKVTDTGIGIDEAHLPHIFDEFRQADGSTSRRFGGSGLGLAIAKKYANLLGGSISVTSTLNAGSEFTLSLPLKYIAENKIIAPIKTSDNNHLISLPITNSINKTILLVEDSEPAIIQIKDFMEESGYNIIVARNGNEALSIIENTIPDAMILDLMMPEIDGFEVLKSLRNAEPTAHIPVLILTAKHITKDDLKELKRNNVHQLIQKGDVNRIELLKAVQTMVSPKIEIKSKPEKTIPQIIGKPTILVVEDNHDNMITVKAILANNYTVIEAIDGKEGIEMALKYLPNLILMDIALPEVDGIEAFKSIRRNGHSQHIPIIALTASAMISDRETILAHGFDAYIAKPIDEIVFFKTINETLYGK